MPLISIARRVYKPRTWRTARFRVDCRGHVAEGSHRILVCAIWSSCSCLEAWKIAKGGREGNLGENAGCFMFIFAHSSRYRLVSGALKWNFWSRILVYVIWSSCLFLGGLKKKSKRRATRNLRENAVYFVFIFADFSRYWIVSGAVKRNCWSLRSFACLHNNPGVPVVGTWFKFASLLGYFNPVIDIGKLHRGGGNIKRD